MAESLDEPDLCPDCERRDVHAPGCRRIFKPGDPRERPAVRPALEAVARARGARPYLTGSMFFDDAPTTRLRARATVRRDVAADIRAALEDS